MEALPRINVKELFATVEQQREAERRDKQRDFGRRNEGGTGQDGREGRGEDLLGDDGCDDQLRRADNGVRRQGGGRDHKGQGSGGGTAEGLVAPEQVLLLRRGQAG